MIPSRQPSDINWFRTWVHQQLGACLTFAKGASCDDLLDAFGVSAQAVADETFAQAAADEERPKVRIGALPGWAYGVEHLLARGGQPDVLRRLSSIGGEAL